MRCPHGFVGSHDLIFAGACFVRECVLEVVETIRRAAVANLELPLQTDPIRWPNEWRLPLGEVAPACLPFLLTLRPTMYEALAFYEQSGAFAHAWGAVGIRAASVANRPSALPPLPQSAHFIAGVKAFHEWYGHPIPFLTTHWDCAPAGYASKARWKALMQSGELPQNVEDAVWCRSICRLFAGETTKSAMEFFLGPPSIKTNLAHWAGDRLKDWWWFLAAGVPVLHPPLRSAPLTARSTHHDRDGLLLERLKLSRGTTPHPFAEAHARGWVQTVRDAQSQPMIAAGTTSAAFEHDLQVSRARLTLWAAADTNIVSRLTEDSVAVDRCILVPVYVEDNIMALVPDSGFLGVACTKGQLAVQSARLAKEAGVSSSTNLVNVSMNSLEGRDYVFSAVARAPPSAAGLNRLRAPPSVQTQQRIGV